MLLDIVVKGSTDRSVILRIIDSTDGTPETGVVFNTSGIDLWYRREGAAKTSITEATLSALTDAHSDGGFLHVGDGYYRLDLPDAAYATAAQYVDVGGTVTGMVVIGGRVRLIDANIEVALATASALDTVDNLIDTEIGDLITAIGVIDDLLDTEIAAILADTNELQTDWANGGRLDLLIDAILADTSELQTDWVNGGRLDLLIDSILADTNELQTDWVNGGRLDLLIDAILADTGELQTDWVDGGRLDLILDARASQASVDTIDDFLDTEISAILAAVDTEVAAILADTAELQVDWVNGGRLDLLIDAIKAKTDSLTFTVAGLIDSNMLRMAGLVAPVTQLAAHAIAAGRLVVDTGSTTTAVVFKTVDGATASAVDDFYNGRFIIFTSGALALQATSISDYVGATKTATVVALTGAPAEDVTAIIV